MINYTSRMITGRTIIIKL